MVARTFIIPVTAASGAPAWFTSLVEKRWTAIPGINTLNAVSSGASLGFGGTFTDMTWAWTGGCVDQTRGELLFVANGGHANWAGNDVYACSIRSASPQWYRLTDPSPSSVITPVPCQSGSSTVSTSNLPAGQGHDPVGYAAMYLDGRMRAVHGWHTVQFANGKAWYPTQASPAGVGNSTSHAWSFNRNFAGIPTAPGGSALAWANNAGPWTWLGCSDGSGTGSTQRGTSFGTAPPAALDPVSGKIWMAHALQAMRVWMSLDTATGTIQRSNVVNIYANNTGQDGRWAAVVTDPTGQDRYRLWVAPAPDAGGLLVLNLKAADPYATAAWSVKTVSNLAALTTAGLGAVYHAPSRSILLGDPRSLTAGQIVKLQVPVNGDGTFNSSGVWAVSTITPALGSAAISVNGGNAGTWSKFNMIADMGNGQSCLVVCVETGSPTYAYKLPMGELL